MPCAPNRIAPPIVPMTGHLYRGYGLRGGRGSGEEGVSHERGRDPGTAVRAFREPPTAAPEQYPGGGDHGGEENGPEVGVVDLLAVHHLPSDVGRGRRGRAHAPRDVLKSNSSSRRKKSAVAEFAASSLFLGSEKGYRSIIWESVRGSNLQKSCDCLSTRSIQRGRILFFGEPERKGLFLRESIIKAVASPAGSPFFCRAWTYVRHSQDAGSQQRHRQCALQEGLARYRRLLPRAHLVQPGRP